VFQIEKAHYLAGWFFEKFIRPLAKTLSKILMSARSKILSKISVNAPPNVKVLLVEDSIDNQIVIKHVLNHVGVSVEVASNGKEAIEKAMLENFDIVFMDLNMPEMDGIEATACLRAKSYAKPIIALTAYTRVEDREKCLARGFNAYLTKPFNRDLLLNTLAHFTGYADA